MRSDPRVVPTTAQIVGKSKDGQTAYRFLKPGARIELSDRAYEAVSRGKKTSSGTTVRRVNKSA